MNKHLGSWIEVTVPLARISLGSVDAALDVAIADVGGATLTESRGYYTREDGTVDYEEVTIVRFDFNIKSELFLKYRSSIKGLIDSLLDAGEECVLRRRYYEPTMTSLYGGPHGYGYRSELIFK